MSRKQVTHLRIHRANAVTWCGLHLTDSRNSTVNVVTVTEDHYRLTSPRYTNGKIDYTPLTEEERAIIRRDRNAVYSQVTCRRCTKNGTRFQPDMK